MGMLQIMVAEKTSRKKGIASEALSIMMLYGMQHLVRNADLKLCDSHILQSRSCWRFKDVLCLRTGLGLVGIFSVT